MPRKQKYANLFQKCTKSIGSKAEPGAAGVGTCLHDRRCAHAVLFPMNVGVNSCESVLMHAALSGFNHGLLHSGLFCTYIYGPCIRRIFRVY